MQYFGSGIWFQSRTTCGAIFFVTVPETISRSAWRGDGRNTSDPKRAMSKRAIEAAIISIAQQARPNCSGQTDLLRPKLTRSWIVVSRMPLRRSSSRSASLTTEGELLVISLISFPFEVAAMPRPDETLGEQQDEGEHRHEGARGQAGKCYGKGQEEQHLDVENQEQNRVEVVMRLELNPRVARRSDAAFIDGIFDRTRPRRLKDPKPELRRAEHHQRDRHRHGGEEGEKGV